MRLYRVGLDPATIADLDAIKAYITKEASETIANRLIERVLGFIDGFGTAPKRGAARDDIRPGLRILSWRRTITLMLVVDDHAKTVVVIGALYRGRNLEAMLNDRFG